MSVITISREFGSLGTLVAERTAQLLGYHLADKQTLETILKDYGLESFDEEYRSIPGFWERFDASRMKQRGICIAMLNNTLRALARHGDIVIIGRGGFAVLAGLLDVLHVRIQAPPRVRMRRLVDSPAIGDPGIAERNVAENDLLQKNFIRSVYGLDWDNVKGFDLVIDTSKIAPERAAGMIAQAARELRGMPANHDELAASLQVDPILAESVHEVLNRQLVPV
jgi:cytidylate kinase